MHQNKLQKQRVHDVANGNKIKFGPYGDLVGQAFSEFNENSIKNQDPHSQIENYETPRAEYCNENDSEDTEINQTSAFPNFMSQILPHDETTKGINSSNSKQREVFIVVSISVKDYVKYDGHDVEPGQIFL